MDEMIKIRIDHYGNSWLFGYDGKFGLILLRKEENGHLINPIEKLPSTLFEELLLIARRQLLDYIGSRLEINCTLKNMILEMLLQKLLEISEDNHGAISALCELVSCGEKNDKLEEVGEYLRMLEMLGVTGTDIYVLFNDICDRDSKKMFIVLWAVRIGRYDALPFSLACSKQDYSGKDIIPVDTLVEIFNKEGIQIEW